MKRIFKITAIALAAILLIAAPLMWWRRNGIREIVSEYRVAILKKALEKAINAQVSGLPNIDRVLVRRFENEPVHPGQTKTLTAVWGDELYLAKEMTLTGAEAENLASIWRRQIVSENGVMCHNPHHAIRFYSRGMLICETVICFHCFNASIPTGYWRDLVMFDKESPDYLRLRSEIERLVGPASDLRAR